MAALTAAPAGNNPSDTTLSACATQPHADAFDPPGFWSGLLHGFTIVFSLIASIFADARIYAFPNSGGWYDLGFVLGASSFLGGSGAGARCAGRSVRAVFLGRAPGDRICVEVAPHAIRCGVSTVTNYLQTPASSRSS